jgi:serine/threonine-protein kinase
VTEQVDRLFLDFQAAVAGRYSLERELGRGGMGVVYLAREVRLDRPVAIKLLPPVLASEPRLRERFLREARTAAKLSHPNVVPIFAVDDAGDFVFFAMAFVDGETLTARVRDRGPLPAGEAARVLREVAWALGYAHAQGVVHRDVKPDNILLEAGTGRALVADFGIAAAAHDATTTTGAGDASPLTGTPEFMAPEQALGAALDARSDLYALGITGYFALTGCLPFTGPTAAAVLGKHVTEPPPPLAEAAVPVPRRMAQLVHRCLAKDPEERPASAADVAAQLGVALERKKELPLALRAFVKHDSRLDGPGVLIYPIGMLVATSLAGFFLNILGSYVVLVGGLALGPVGVLVARARRVLRAGFGHGDLAHAFKAEIEQGQEERAFGGGHGASRFEKWLRAGAVLGFGTVAVSLALGWNGMWGLGTADVLLPLMSLAGLVGLGSSAGALILLQRRRDVDSEVYARFWTGWPGRWLFKLARWFTPRGVTPAALTHRPTEVSIGLAAEQLFEKLPKDARRRLGDLPALLRRLGDDAQRMRSRLEELSDALAGPPASGRAARLTADLTRERELVQNRLGEAVAALETIRLGLLRLHAGTGSVQSLTTDLGLAARVAADVDRLLAGQAEADSLLRPTERPDPA